MIYIVVSEAAAFVDSGLIFDILWDIQGGSEHVFPTCLVLMEIEVLQSELLTKQNFL